jgi:hypothetical protein
MSLDGDGIEKRGLPAAVVVTAAAIALLAGLPHYPAAVMPHPVGSLTLAEVIGAGGRDRPARGGAAPAPRLTWPLPAPFAVAPARGRAAPASG